ncbi:MAG: amidohydrolase family protein [Prolixibacteraceae bacterium]|jgi:predicted TIM-barrel fold metal-dependent hydrolase|nr:amidohydrolase family protein [Prolixibacteraceae bacterium]
MTHKELDKIDGHTHLQLETRDYPRDIFGILSRFLMKKKKRLIFASKFLSAIIPGGKDLLERYAILLMSSTQNTEEKIRKALEKVDCVNLLSVNLEHIGCGKCERSHAEQLEEMIRMKKLFAGQVKNFMMLDPNDPNILRDVAKYHTYMDGWKYYPPVSGTINNRLVNYVLAKHPKPIIIHTTDTSPIYNHKWDKSKAQSFANPCYTVPLLSRYPKVTFIFAHFGGRNYINKVTDISKSYPNAYTDISYTYANDKEMVRKHFNLIPDKGLWGTDSPMERACLFFDFPAFEKAQENNHKVFGN